jgi:hypothetical protein
MRIKKIYKLDACKADELRPFTQVVKLTKNHAIVTNGNILAVVPITRETNDTASYLSPALLKKARQAGLKRNDEVVINDLNGTGTLPDGSILPNVNFEDKYPALKVFPTGEKKLTISFNVRLLADLADVLGTETVIMDIYECKQSRFNGEVFKVRPMDKQGENKAHGLLMGTARE